MPKTFICCLVIIGEIKKQLPEKFVISRAVKTSGKPKKINRVSRRRIVDQSSPLTDFKKYFLLMLLMKPRSAPDLFSIFFHSQNFNIKIFNKELTCA